MSETLHTFKVVCPHRPCQRPFHVRFVLARADAEGSGDVVVTCQYCSKQVVVTVPRVYIAEDALVRGLSSRAIES